MTLHVSSAELRAKLNVSQIVLRQFRKAVGIVVPAAHLPQNGGAFFL
jgi:hypothetical protein